MYWEQEQQKRTFHTSGIYCYFTRASVCESEWLSLYRYSNKKLQHTDTNFILDSPLLTLLLFLKEERDGNILKQVQTDGDCLA